MDNEWTFDPPTEPGVYWFSGWTSEYAAHQLEQETILVYVSQNTSNGKLFLTDRAQILYLRHMYGVWLRASMPTAPVLDANDYQKR